MAGREALTRAQYTAWYRQAGLPELRQMLLWRWDPLGVASAFPRTLSEYDAYAQGLLSRLETGVSVEEIAAYLEGVEIDTGLRATSRQELLDLGAQVVAWVDDSIDFWTESMAPASMGSPIAESPVEDDLELDDLASVPWFGVRRVFRFNDGTYEERVTIWRASSMEEADRLAEAEAAEYAEIVGARSLAFAQLYHAAELPGHGAEVFSLMRDSELEPDDYLDHFFDDGEERQGTLE